MKSVQYEKTATWKKCNIDSKIRKECNTEKVQHEKKIHSKKVKDEKNET